MLANTPSNSPIWQPGPEELTNSNLALSMKELGFTDYPSFHNYSAKNRIEFWENTFHKLGIKLQTPYQQFCDLTQGEQNPRWLVGAKLNIVDSCFQARPDAIAIYHQTPRGEIQTVTYGKLYQRVLQIAACIQKAGFQPGDVIAIDMPMHDEAVAIFLGIIKAGCTVCCIAESFAPEEIASRLRITQAKAIFIQDNLSRNGKSHPLYEKFFNISPPPAIVLQREKSEAFTLQPQDINYDDFLEKAGPEEYLNSWHQSDDSICILFSSGTTGQPKAIPWHHHTPIKCASDAYYHHNLKSHNIFAWPTSLGWMMGPFLVFATLINQAAMALSSDAPIEKRFGRFIEETRVTHVGVVPSIVRRWHETKMMESCDWKSVELFSSTGECSNSADMTYLSALAGGKPIIEYCGGTEIAGAYITGTVVQPCIASTFTTPALGLDFVLLNEQGQPSSRGEVAIIPPSLGLSITLLNADHDSVYYQNMPQLENISSLRRHGDEIEEIQPHLYRALGRVDDAMNLGGIKVSSAEIERTLGLIDLYQETAAIAVEPADGGPSQLIIYLVPTEKTPDDKIFLEKKMKEIIREKLNPLFKIHDIQFIALLPRTASNKVMHRTLRNLYMTSR